MTPSELAKSGSEHGHQRALFAWLNMAARYGFIIANSDNAYRIRGWVDEMAEIHKDNFGVRPRPELAFAFAIHNQGHGDRIRGNRARVEGVKAGAPDLMLPVARRFDNFSCGLFIEMKRPSEKPKREGKGGVKDAQSVYHRFLENQGYKVAVCYGWRDAANVIQSYVER